MIIIENILFIVETIGTKSGSDELVQHLEAFNDEDKLRRYCQAVSSNENNVSITIFEVRPIRGWSKEDPE